MTPEERLEEACKQVHLVLREEHTTDKEDEWLEDGLRNLRATQAAIEGKRQARDDAEVVDE